MNRHLGVLMAAVFGTVSTVTLHPESVSAAVTPQIYAHRGGTSIYVENTISAFKASPLHNWETDVRFTSDNVPVLLHDATLTKFNCPTVTITAVTFTQARTCKATNGQVLNTLYEFMVALNNVSGSAFIELKTIPTAIQWTNLKSRLSMTPSTRVVLESFLAEALVAAGMQGYNTAFLSSTYTNYVPKGTDWYFPSWPTLTPGQVTYYHGRGIKIAVWTPPKSSWPQVPAGTDAIISNDHP